jgi:hypothetical protein
MLYESFCGRCNKWYDYTSSVELREVTPLCETCGDTTVKGVRTAPAGFIKGGGAADFKPFMGADGTVVDSQIKLDEHMRKNNLVNLHDGFSEEKILSGDIKPKEDKVKRVREAKADIVEAVQKVNQGYKPEVRNED